jgi:integrase
LVFFVPGFLCLYQYQNDGGTGAGQGMGGTAMKWMSSGVKGVRYREHPERLHRGAPDRYFSIRFKRQGKDIEEGLGWSSEGWTVRKASELRDQIQAGHVSGEGPATLRERRQARTADGAAGQAGQPALLYRELVETHYIPWSLREKKSAWLDEIRLKNHIYPVFGDSRLEDISAEAVEQFREALLEEWEPATVKQILALLRKTFNHLTALGLFDRRNPASRVKMPRLDNACERFLTRDEYRRLLDAAMETQCCDLHDAAILAVNTGLRLGEIIRLMPADIDLAHGYLTVREDGGKPGGIVPLNRDAAVMLRRRLADHDGGLVFPPSDQRGKELSKQFWWVAQAVGLNTGQEDRRHRLTFHSLRHTFASWLALKDVDLYRIQKLMRHKTPAMTQRYAHLRPSWLASDVAVLCDPEDPPASPADPFGR